MKRGTSLLKGLWQHLMVREPTKRDKYGQWYVDKAYVAAEIELCIGLVTTALILIYQQNFWLALGTLVGFLILEFFLLMGISVAENIITLRQHMETLVLAKHKESKRQVDAAVAELEDPYKLVRIFAISTLVTLGIVVGRMFF